MSEAPKTPDELVAEFKWIDKKYKELRQQHEREVSSMLVRRREIIQELINNDGAVRPRTHRQVGEMLALSGGRVGQLVMGAPGYVPQRTYPTTDTQRRRVSGLTENGESNE